jgi:NAD(P)-dependent dehydrogenase (short-subunit alcohol dehydrogenase family)
MANKSKDRGADPQEARPAQSQDTQPGRRSEMTPLPQSVNPDLKGSGLLEGRVALITGGDSGIGRAVAIAFAREGADVAIAYLDEHDDAQSTCAEVEGRGRRCLLISGDIGDPDTCQAAVDSTITEFGRLDVLVNNAAEQHEQSSITDITPEQLLKTFQTNLFSMFYLSSAALPHLRKSGAASIINTSSVTAYRGSPSLVDYAATKGAIIAFTRSLSGQLAEEGIRVNAVAPGPIWTPLIPATFDAEKVASFGTQNPLGRAGEPWECAECYVFLASAGASYITGQTLHPNGGEIING